jgi:elongation factor Ts
MNKIRRNTMNTIEAIKQLRSETGAGVMECHKAFEQGDQDFDRALAFLQELAVIKAKKQTNREALDGKIELYSHNNGRIGVMVEINTETEFASRSQIFGDFTHEIALQITAMSPLYVRDEDIPQEILTQLAQEASERARRAGKPERIIEKIVEGVLEKYKNGHVLMRQPYLRDENITIAQLLTQMISQIGENIVIRRFIRWEVNPDTENE